MKPEYKRINIALITSQTVANLANALSAQIAQANRTPFILDSRNYFPHISLYAAEFLEGKKNRIEYAVNEVAQKYREIACAFDSVVGVDDGGIYINLKPSEEIRKLCDDVIDAVNPIRESYVKERYADPEVQGKMSKKQINLINKYGSWRIKEFFEPHITISVVEPKESAGSIASKIVWPIKEFTCSSIGMFVTGEWGTCTHLIKMIPLNN